MDILAIYLSTLAEDRCIPLGSAEEEQELGAKIQKGQMAQERLNGAGVLPAPVQAKLERCVAQGRAARNELVERNMRLGVWVARKYSWTQCPQEDLIQAANMGLIVAAQRFQPQKGYRFTSYAFSYLRRYVSEEATTFAHPMRIPSEVHRKMRDVRCAIETLTAQGVVPTPQVIAHHTGMHVKSVNICLPLLGMCPSRSLNESYGNNPEMETTLIEMIPSPHASQIATYDTEESLTVAMIMADVPEPEASILGLWAQSHTTDAIGELFGVTGETIRTRRDKGLQMLREGTTTIAADLWLTCPHPSTQQRTPALM